MISKISIIILILSICSFIDGKRLFLNNDNDLELSNEKAQMFLRSMLNDDENSDDDSMDKREFGKNCVPCKFKINPCCAPNICVKKFFWNECMEIKIKGLGK
ncbi:unnamed protein product [Rotaria socialis]|uniref:Uncharacterized protein n=1 Tax=Rotaria socialis TaxID=392032 RepID=A0A817UKD3_9BILA|nr:unnamed protein product [Rotaria socialis]CAF3331622.1 unnamed protein product [Rotaria socialis]CAF3555457.1 unnamed protein product [Rotaria socialis]CAF3627671.1 unnamed protein product [Rotaria socialis]CAF4221783.1 unnamed protein product [Rotaria socialis]